MKKKKGYLRMPATGWFMLSLGYPNHPLAIGSKLRFKTIASFDEAWTLENLF